MPDAVVRFKRGDEPDMVVTVPEEAIEVRLCPDGSVLVIMPSADQRSLGKLLDTSPMTPPSFTEHIAVR